MAETQQYDHQQHPTDTQTQSIFPAGKGGPSASQFLACAILVPLGGILFFLSGITLIGTVIGLAVATPLFVIFGPVLLPAALVIGLVVTGFLTSGAFGVTGISSLAWLANYTRRSRLPEQLEHAKRRAEETAGHAAKRTKEVSESAVSKAQEAGQTGQSKPREADKAQEKRRT